MSLQEQYEYQPSILSNNLHQAVKIAEREEKKLVKENLLDDFNAEFEKMVKNGWLREITQNDRDIWSGPVNYVSLQHVIKQESTTTPLRIVTNSSLTDRNGVSLNGILMKGPKSISDQREVISRWRSYEVGLSSDITKAYFNIRTGELEMHLRRVVWRYGDNKSQWRHTSGTGR